VNVTEFLENCKEEATRWCEQAKLHLHWQVAADLPPVHTDPTKLKIVVRNLLNNAVKFTKEGSVTVAARPRAGGLEIKVSDTGIGIAPEILPTIFDLFLQGDRSTTRHYGGIGVGLYIVRQMLNLLGGKIEVESEPGKGSTFCVWLPNG
jgi:two-component system capsular synthesis sensor histidine kinase RcsC